MRSAPSTRSALVGSRRRDDLGLILGLSDQEREVLNLLTNEPQHIDEVVAGGSLETSRVISTLTVLEMRRLVHRMPGGMVVRVTH